MAFELGERRLVRACELERIQERQRQLGRPSAPAIPGITVTGKDQFGRSYSHSMTPEQFETYRLQTAVAPKAPMAKSIPGNLLAAPVSGLVRDGYRQLKDAPAGVTFVRGANGRPVQYTTNGDAAWRSFKYVINSNPAAGKVNFRILPDAHDTHGKVIDVSLKVGKYGYRYENGAAKGSALSIEVGLPYLESDTVSTWFNGQPFRMIPGAAGANYTAWVHDSTKRAYLVGSDGFVVGTQYPGTPDLRLSRGP